jgi:hypothetical protein
MRHVSVGSRQQSVDWELSYDDLEGTVTTA